MEISRIEKRQKEKIKKTRINESGSELEMQIVKRQNGTRLFFQKK